MYDNWGEGGGRSREEGRIIRFVSGLGRQQYLQQCLPHIASDESFFAKVIELHFENSAAVALYMQTICSTTKLDPVVTCMQQCVVVFHRINGLCFEASSTQCTAH